MRQEDSNVFPSKGGQVRLPESGKNMNGWMILKGTEAVLIEGTTRIYPTRREARQVQKDLNIGGQIVKAGIVIMLGALS